jgi:hypothetical protein
LNSRALALWPAERKTTGSAQVSEQCRMRQNKPNKAAAEKKDAEGQFVRRRRGSNPTKNPDGLHSAAPVVLSGNGDATQPVRKGEELPAVRRRDED